MEVYSQASEDLTLALSERESKLSGKSRLTATAEEFWSEDSLTLYDSQTSAIAADAIAAIPVDGAMVNHRAHESTISGPLTSSAADFPARTSATPESAPESTENAADCGASTRESFANYDPATSSWRTSQLCLDGEWSEFSETWPRAGMTRNGKAYELPMLVPRTEENESGLWPTPNVAGGGNPPEILEPYKNHFIRPSGQKAHLSLDQAVKMYPTPNVAMVKGSSAGAMTSKNGKSRERDRLDYFLGADNPALNGRLNPTWVEWLMGYPLNWTALEESKATIRKRSQRLKDLSGESCSLCGSTKNLQRHHRTYTEKDFQVLCQECHTKQHIADGSWGRGSKKRKNCVICGTEFMPRHSKKHSTCSPNCLSELGRRNARKRWPELTALEDSETPSSRKSQSGLEAASSRRLLNE